MLVIVRWWLVIFIIGVSFMPLTSIIFASFNDKGYFFSKPIGIAIVGYVLWVMSTLRIFKFTEISAIIILSLCILINILIAFFMNKKKNKIMFSKDIIKTWIMDEVVFIILLLIFIYLKTLRPAAYGTEKFMDYGFMTSIMRCDYLPPEDFWFAGKKLNYYYIGQYFGAYLTKLSFLEVKYTYNLMLMTITTLGYLLTYSLVYNISKNYSIDNKEYRSWISKLAGLISTLAVNLAGNLHYTVYRWIIPLFNIYKNEEVSYRYWFPDATRYIGYFPETKDKTIHEFPSYSYILGDLHAHVINIIFVLTIIAILYGWLYTRNMNKDLKTYDKINVREEIFLNPFIIMIGFFLGLFQTTNFWDFPIYYIVAGAIILFSNLRNYKLTKNAILATSLQGVYILALAQLFALPFILNFEFISSRILLVDARTPFYQWALLWILPVLFVILFIIILQKTKKTPLNFSDLFILLLSLCAIGLIIMPEIIYIEDIYPDHKRANTMFKLTYQAFILFGISIGYIYMRVSFFVKSKKAILISKVLLVIFGTTCLYSVNAYKSFFGNPFKFNESMTLDSSAFLYTELEDDYYPIEWINDNIKGNPIMLEAAGDSYSDYQRVSVFTGLPTVIGWETHEWLWRSSYDIVAQRQRDVETIYTSYDLEEVRALVEEYNISYIYVGKLEEDKYGEINHDLLARLGDIVYSLPEEDISEFATYIIKIKN